MTHNFVNHHEPSSVPRTNRSWPPRTATLSVAHCPDLLWDWAPSSCAPFNCRGSPSEVFRRDSSSTAREITEDQALRAPLSWRARACLPVSHRFPLNEGPPSSSPLVLKPPSPIMEPAITTTTASNTPNALLDDPSSTQKMSIKGVVLLARNGDRLECHQDPKTYQYGPTESTPFGEASASLTVFRCPSLMWLSSINLTNWELSSVTPTSLGVVIPKSPGSPPTLRTSSRFTSV